MLMVGAVRPGLEHDVGHSEGTFCISGGNGALWGSGAACDVPFATGDRIGMLLDLDAGWMHFFRNGKQCGPGFAEGVTGPVVRAVQLFSNQRVTALPGAAPPHFSATPDSKPQQCDGAIDGASNVPVHTGAGAGAGTKQQAELAEQRAAEAEQQAARTARCLAMAAQRATAGEQRAATAEQRAAAAEQRAAAAEQRVAVLEAQLGARTSAGAIDLESASSCGQGGGAGGQVGGSGSPPAGLGLAQLHAAQQQVLQVKQEKDDLNEELEDKDELCQQVVLSEDRKHDAIDRLKARLRTAGVEEHEISALAALQW